MKISILCVGRIKETYWNDAIAEYTKRLSRYCSLQIREVPDEAVPDNASPALEAQILDTEGKRLMKCIGSDSGSGSFVIALAIDGKKMDSVRLSEKIGSLAVSGHSHILFVIGGSLGLSDQVLKRADMKLSFSDLTFPHQLMRVILLEQIYRAMRIAHGEPYHK